MVICISDYSRKSNYRFIGSQVNSYLRNKIAMSAYNKLSNEITKLTAYLLLHLLWNRKSDKIMASDRIMDLILLRPPLLLRMSWRNKTSL